MSAGFRLVVAPLIVSLAGVVIMFRFHDGRPADIWILPGWVLVEPFGRDVPAALGIGIAFLVWSLVVWAALTALTGRWEVPAAVVAAIVTILGLLGFRTTEYPEGRVHRSWGHVVRATVDRDRDGIFEAELGYRWGMYSDPGTHPPIRREKRDVDRDGRWDVWIDRERDEIRVDLDGDGAPDSRAPIGDPRVSGWIERIEHRAEASGR